MLTNDVIVAGANENDLCFLVTILKGDSSGRISRFRRSTYSISAMLAKLRASRPMIIRNYSIDQYDVVIAKLVLARILTTNNDGTPMGALTFKSLYGVDSVNIDRVGCALWTRWKLISYFGTPK